MKKFSLAVLGLMLGLGASSAFAHDSVGFSLNIGVPGYYAAPPAPVYYSAPPVVYYSRPPVVYYQPAPVYYGPPAYIRYDAPRWYHRGDGHGWGHRHWRD